MKAAIRDVKSYRESKGYRNIPVGYSAGKLTMMIPILDCLVSGPIRYLVVPVR